MRIVPINRLIFSYLDYAMVNFVKPSLLGSKEDFREMYATPIAKGQHKDSSPHQIKLMRLQSFNLNRELKSVVHVSGFYANVSEILQQRIISFKRREVSLLLQDLPEKHEYVLYIPMSEKQVSELIWLANFHLKILKYS